MQKESCLVLFFYTMRSFVIDEIWVMMSLFGTNYCKSAKNINNLLRLNRKRQVYVITRVTNNLFNYLGNILAAGLSTFVMYLIIEYEEVVNPPVTVILIFFLI